MVVCLLRGLSRQCHYPARRDKAIGGIRRYFTAISLIPHGN